jgi:hypothetical protein
MKLLFIVCGFAALLSQMVPLAWMKSKPAAVIVPDRETARRSLVFMTATSFMLVVWGTLDTEPWQLDLLYFLALGWVLVPHFRRGMDERNRLRGTGPQLTESAKENGTR